MGNVIPFEFETSMVRVVEIDGNPWFVAVDVCNILGLSSPTKTVQRLDDDEVTLTQIQGSHRPTNVVNESGLFALILRSDKPEAKRLRKWVTSEVLPQIRKTGQYQSQQLLPQFQAIQDLVLLANDHEQRIRQVEDKVSEYDAETGYRSDIGYCRMIDVSCPKNVATAIGKRATKLCKERGLSVGEVPDERFGRVGSYPIAVLEEVVPEYLEGSAA